MLRVLSVPGCGEVFEWPEGFKESDATKDKSELAAKDRKEHKNLGPESEPTVISLSVFAFYTTTTRSHQTF
jgi:hypothetical protein